mmetsp:Transcript_33833/g.34463  ORF Transcript_33833/g.34463 Transcript_33833/m.34463 type:complete len:142 (+) Transcript_33833:173-598(+)
MGTQTVLITARFYTTMGHIIALLLLFSTIQSNINISLSDNSNSVDREEAIRISWAAILFGAFCFILDITGMLSGASIFSAPVNFFQIICHFVGGILISRFIINTWPYETLWPIILCCNLPTAVFEIYTMLSIFCLRKVVLY